MYTTALYVGGQDKMSQYTTVIFVGGEDKMSHYTVLYSVTV